MKEYVITSALREDDETIRLMIKSKLDGFDYTMRQSGRVMKIRIDDTGFEPAKRSGLTRRMNNLKTKAYFQNYYDNRLLNAKSPGSASGDMWNENIPVLADGDTNFMWNHDCVNFPSALKIASTAKFGVNHLDPSMGHLASGITVYQFDSGYSKHPAIHSYEGYFSQDKSVSEGKSVSAILKVRSAKDSGRSYKLAKKAFQKPCHGTATAFTMIGQNDNKKEEWEGGPISLPHLNNAFINNLGGGLYPYVKFVPVLLSRTVSLSGALGGALLKNVGNARNINRAIEAAVGHAQVITMSMGGEFFPSSIKRSIRRAYKAGIIVVCAAGNSKKADKLFGVIKPAEYRETIGVSALMPIKIGQDYRIVPWPESGKGRETDVSAPGKYIYTAYKLDPRRIDPDPQFDGLLDKADQGDLYKFGGATSQATVHVASAAAMWRSYYRDMLKDDFYSSKGNQYRIVEAFRFALYKSLVTPSHWREEDSPQTDEKDKLSVKEKLEFKGLLNAAGLLSPEFSPERAECKAFILQTTRKEHSALTAWEIFKQL